MRPQHPIAGCVTALALLLYTETSAIAQGTDQQREACTPDAFRLCGAYIPDVDRITACLRGNGSRLSRPCYDVFLMCFSRPKSWTRGDDLIDGLILQTMTMIERKGSARAKAAREGPVAVGSSVNGLV